MTNSGRYTIILYWSEEDRAFLAKVPELAGCIADGATYQEALANVEIVIQQWLEKAHELSRHIPEPKDTSAIHEDNSMSMVQIELDRELVNVLQLTPGRLEDTMKEYLVLELYRRHQISTGKAAELLGVRLVEFIPYASRLGIPYIDMDEEELKAEIEAARKFA